MVCSYMQAYRKRKAHVLIETKMQCFEAYVNTQAYFKTRIGLHINNLMIINTYDILACGALYLRTKF